MRAAASPEDYGPEEAKTTDHNLEELRGDHMDNKSPNEIRRQTSLRAYGGVFQNCLPTLPVISRAS